MTLSRLRRVSFDRELAPLGITRSQWWVLAFISRNDGLPQTRLAHDLDVGKVALGSLVDRLQAAGFVVRKADDKDRRVKRIFLTDKARDLIKRIAPVNDSFNTRILAGIPRKDLELTSKDALRDEAEPDRPRAGGGGTGAKGGGEARDGRRPCLENSEFVTRGACRIIKKHTT